MSKYDDCHRVDNKYTTAIGMSVWRFFNIGKYKNQKVKDVCYFNPFYVAWCLESWHRKVDSFTCNNIFVRFITAYPPVTGVAS